MKVTNQNARGINASTLKMIAIIGMTLDHIGIAFGAQLPPWGICILYTPGGITFPIMAFLLTEGYRHTRDYKKYTKRLLLFALISLVPFAWALNPVFNVIVTLLLGLVTIYLYDTMKNRVGFWFAFIGIIIFTIICDWSIVGVPMILGYHTITKPGKRVVIPVTYAWGMIICVSVINSLINPGFVVMDVLPNLLFAFVGCTATIFLLQRYNGEKGRSWKYFFYIYYPAHLLVLGVLRGLLFGIWTPF